MVSFEVGGVQFHLRAAAVVLEGGWVLLHRLEGDEIWALPGGRVNSGETAASAVARELLEETAQVVQVGEVVFLVENFFDMGQMSNHEVGLYFRTSLSAESPLRDTSKSHVGVEGAARLEYRWFRCSELEDLNLRPAFLRQALSESELSFRHVIQGGDNAL